MTSSGPFPSVDWSRGCAMPGYAPLYPDFPFVFRDVWLLSMVYRTDEAAVRAFLPRPLAYVSPFVLVHVYRMGDVQHAGRINECNVMLPCRLDRPGDDVTGAFSVALFLDSDVGLAHGREVHGQPKKLARVELDVRRDLVVARVARNGIDILTATAPYKIEPGEISELEAYADFRNNINLKAIPDIGGGLLCRQLTGRTLRVDRIHESWRAPFTLSLGRHVLAPLYRLPVVEELVAIHWHCDFTLTGGEVLLDLLSPVAHAASMHGE